MIMNASLIRATFLDFFKAKEHLIVQSAPIVVKNDPTLMFTNAGMNQFKDVFLGNEKFATSRVADTQKCLRVSGKHNDLEEVGYDTYHHTMFEMLGNWSFGDYFKKEAIEWAWELLTEVYKIDKNRLYITVFGGDSGDKLEADHEALQLWKQFVPDDRILFGNKKDNFWEMGDAGPCGPCSEIHADIRSDEERERIPGSKLVNKDHPEVIEIWNLVFIEFNRQADGKLVKLPSRHVDTGMGFERLCTVLQHKKSNYDTDVFQPIITEIARLANTTYGADKSKDVAMRVIADHLRAVSFAIADGQLPSNTGAGYVIRRILRRAVRYGFTFLGFDEPFVHKLVSVLASGMESNFPEIRSQIVLVTKVIQEEEASFLRTLSQGIRRFENYAKLHESSKNVDGQFAFELFDTFGFPVDLTSVMAKEIGFTVDMVGFNTRLDEQKNRSRKAAEVATGDWIIVGGGTEKTEFTGYNHLTEQVSILRYRIVESKKGKHFEIILDKTPFYAESGGQVGDTGVIYNSHERIEVVNTVKENNLMIHVTATLPQHAETTYTAEVNREKRLMTANNHSATHLMHAALRRVLGNHVEQKGSLVDSERLRFDFSHFGKLSPSEIKNVENIVNEHIRKNTPVDVMNDMALDKAIDLGAMALFGEKYGEKVRVVAFDPSYSIELCGGTHAERSGQIGSFRIVSESAIAAGVRRIEAVTGLRADEYIDKQLDYLQQIKEILGGSADVVKNVQHMAIQNSLLQKQIEQFEQEKIHYLASELLKEVKSHGNIQVVIKQLPVKAEMLKSIATQLRSSLSSAMILICSVDDAKVSLCLAISDDLISAYNLDSAALIREIAKEVQGGGGGQKQLATAGGKNPAGIENAFSLFLNLASQIQK